MTRNDLTMPELAGPGRIALTCLLAAALLSACGTSAPAAPPWQFEARSALDRATAAYLDGRTRIEAAEMSRARSALAGSGRADLLANAELTLCAAQVASLVFEACPAFDALRADATPAQLAYAAYLRGQATAGSTALLPEAQRAVAQGASAPPASGDALSQLVAAGVLLQSGRASPAVAAQAVDVASAQGWRRPLLAWLGVQLRLAGQGGAADEAAQIRRRIALVESSLKTPATSLPLSSVRAASAP